MTSYFPISSIVNGTIWQPGTQVPAYQAKVFVYLHGTYDPIGNTGTPVIIYTSETGLTPLAAPVLTDINGQPPGFLATGQVVDIVAEWRGKRVYGEGLVGETVGPAGSPGVGANWRGVYSSGTTYALNDGASESGFLFISNVAGNLNHDPVTETGAGNYTHWSPLTPPGSVMSSGVPGGALTPNATRTSTYAIPALRDFISSTDFGTVGDGKYWGGASVTGSTVTLAGTFFAADVGKTIVIAGAGSSGDAIVRTVTGWTTNTLTLNSAVTTNQANTIIHYGTDNGTALRAFIAQIILTGAKGLVPRGNYLYTGALDFSAMQGKFLGCGFFGEGAGGFNSGWSSATNLWWAGTGEGITAFGTASQYLTGLKMGGFLVKCLRLLGSTKFAIYWDNVLANSGMEDVAVSGYTGMDENTFSNAQQGNGVWINNMDDGGLTFRRLNVWNFQGPASEGIRFGAHASAYRVTAANSGNCLLESCIVAQTTIGYHFYCDASTNGCAIVGCKAVAIGGTNPYLYGFWLDASFRANSFISAFAESYHYGFYINGAAHNTFMSPLSANGSVTPGDLSTAFYFDNGASSNTFLSAVPSGVYDYWVGLAAATGTGNRIEYNPDGYSPLAADLNDASGNAQYNTIVSTVDNGNGRQALTLSAGVIAAIGLTTPFAKLTRDASLELGGYLQISGATKTAGSTIATLPARLRPSRDVYPQSGAILIEAGTGHLITQNGITSGDQYSLDGVVFSRY